MNPILPVEFFCPDVEARQWRDGRMYLYGSLDISGRTGWCSWEYRVFSSADLLHWEDHGVSLRTVPPEASVSWSDAPLYAPDCVYHDGRYYLFFCDARNTRAWAESLRRPGPSPTPCPWRAPTVTPSTRRRWWTTTARSISMGADAPARRPAAARPARHRT